MFNLERVSRVMYYRVNSLGKFGYFNDTYCSSDNLPILLNGYWLLMNATSRLVHFTMLAHCATATLLHYLAALPSAAIAVIQLASYFD